MSHYAQDPLSDSELDILKTQLRCVMPRLTKRQIYELGDMLFDEARQRRYSVANEPKQFSVTI